MPVLARERDAPSVVSFPDVDAVVPSRGPLPFSVVASVPWVGEVVDSVVGADVGAAVGAVVGAVVGADVGAVVTEGAVVAMGFLLRHPAHTAAIITRAKTSRQNLFILIPPFDSCSSPSISAEPYFTLVNLPMKRSARKNLCMAFPGKTFFFVAFFTSLCIM